MQRPPVIVHSFDRLTPASLMLVALRLWEWPMLLGTAWWGAMADGCCPRTGLSLMSPHHPADAQLMIPEPIEADGEHALVA